MRIVTVGLHLLLLLFLHPVTSDDLIKEADPQVDVFDYVSPCSVTCGVGYKTETLCSVRDAKDAQPNNKNKINNGTAVSEKVKCTETLLCGLSTMTVTSGERVELDCLGEITEILGRFSWRVSWRLARGVITSDDTLFTRLEAPQLDRVILDPVSEENAGTYRCIVQNELLHRVKIIYWGIRVLSDEFLNLDYESALAQWNSTRDPQTAPEQNDIWVNYLIMMQICLCVAVVRTGLYWMVKRRVFDRFIPSRQQRLTAVCEEYDIPQC